MNRYLRSGVVALALCSFSLVGCETKRLWLQVTGIDDGIIEGVWLWRLSEQSGSYERACRFLFGGETGFGDIESLAYTQECEDGQTGYALTVPVKRSQNQPDTITVGLWYLDWVGAGVYKVSSYGLYGETSLSDSTLEL